MRWVLFCVRGRGGGSSEGPPLRRSGNWIESAQRVASKMWPELASQSSHCDDHRCHLCCLMRRSGNLWSWADPAPQPSPKSELCEADSGVRFSGDCLRLSDPLWVDSTGGSSIELASSRDPSATHDTQHRPQFPTPHRCTVRGVAVHWGREMPRLVGRKSARTRVLVVSRTCAGLALGRRRLTFVVFSRLLLSPVPWGDVDKSRHFSPKCGPGRGSMS